MRYIVFILFLLHSFCVTAQVGQVAQLNLDKATYPNARTVICSEGGSAPYNYTPTNNNYTSGLLSYHPRNDQG